MESASPPPIVGIPHDHENEIARQVVVLREYHIAEAATSVLAIVLERTTSIPLPDEHSARQHRTAVTVASIRAFRALRAGMAMLCRGYALEADMLTRVMLELYVAATEILAETSGQEAERWLTKGMGKGIKARVDARVPQPEGVYGPLSRAAHGDPRAVLGLLIAADDEHAIEWGPALTPHIADVLRSYAVGARDFAVLLEQVAQNTHPEVERLDEMLVAAVPGFDPAKDWSTGT
jgi:predicted component of type VI protein secretion system